MLDIRNVMAKIEEVEKLKFVLLNEAQLSMFNLSSRELCSLDIKTMGNNEFNKFKEFQYDKIKINKAMDIHSKKYLDGRILMI